MTEKRIEDVVIKDNKDKKVVGTVGDKKIVTTEDTNQDEVTLLNG